MFFDQKEVSLLEFIPNGISSNQVFRTQSDYSMRSISLNEVCCDFAK